MNILPLKRLSDSLINTLFTYHQFGSDSYIGLNRISSSKFETHLNILNEMGFSSDPKYKILFDDGYESVYDIAFPLMKKYGFTGLVFPVANYIGKMNTWDVTFGSFNKARHLNSLQIKELSENGWEIGSHGLSHAPFTRMADKLLKYELLQSKEILENIINREVLSITPPFSKFNNHIKEIVIRSGYQKIYFQASFNFNGDKNLIPRHTIYSLDSQYSILRKLNKSNIELLKELIIQNCSSLTVAFKEIL